MASSPLITSKQKLIAVSCVAVWVGSLIIQTGLLLWFDFNFGPAIVDSLISSTTIAAACYIIGNNLNYYQPRKERYFYIIIWGLCLAAISLTINRYALQYTISDKAYLVFLDLSLPIRYCTNSLLIAWVAIMHVLWNTLHDQKENEQRKADAEKLAREAELYNLRQQLQPHFLFNSLNSIIALIGRKPEEARNMTFQLSDFLRGTLRKDDQQLISLKDEIEHLKLYLEIEKVRFGHRLDTDINYDIECDTCLLPAMILQPLVENAIKYGLYDTTGKVKISIHAKKEEQHLSIAIQNPFDKESNKPHKGTGFGLRGVQRRLFLLFGRTDLLQTHHTAHIFTSNIKIPQT
ncbi:sensor histidine kinase [Olivibacter domesticus]|uniref:Histidine kinase n=1 Tax=Olivibacter domesticus TaxID=407022 RepID=A0A1H7YJ70_OLID1|nr:histidine kinase [Olivibacter domesticus]SEM46302.1 Histidine kinase [Olivibacter domesticus]